MLKFENIVKGIFATVLGSIMMALAFYGWWNDRITDYQGIGLGIIGFVLLFMRNVIPVFITNFIYGLIEKYTGRKINGHKNGQSDSPAPPPTP